MLGGRIKRARKALRLSLRDLAKKVSLSHASIKKYEDNRVIPSSEVLIKLAKAMQVKVEYFFRPERFTLENIQYKKHVDMPDYQSEEIILKILDPIERRIELESLFPSHPIKNFSINLKKIHTHPDIEGMAIEVRKQWSLGLEPISNLIDIFEENGIRVFEVDNQQYPKFDGLSATINHNPIIVIGNQWPGDRQRFTLAHELGHLILSGLSNADFQEEKSCDRFAGAFLLPKKALVSLLGRRRNEIEPRELNLLKQEFGISMLSVLHRLEEVEIISTRVHRQLRHFFKTQGWSKTEPGEPYPKQKTYRFEHLIFRALAEEYIGESKAAELMNISAESFKSMRAMAYQSVVINQ